MKAVSDIAQIRLGKKLYEGTLYIHENGLTKGFDWRFIPDDLAPFNSDLRRFNFKQREDALSDAREHGIEWDTQ